MRRRAGMKGGSGMGRALVLVLLVLFAGWPAFGSEDAAVWKGRKVAGAMTDDIQKRVFDTMKESGPEAAASVCAYQATAIARDAEKREGVKAKRTSLKVRNPLNAPDDYEKAIMERFEALSLEGSLPVERIEFRGTGGAGVYRYTKPIVVDQRCLACHGAPGQISESVRIFIEDRYPKDRAKGYKAGDFIGIVSVMIPDEQAR
jgi:hypothetical protein